MIPAVLTVLAWSCSAICSARAATAFGATRANRLRLLLSTAVLAGIALLAARSALPHCPAALPWFLLSGVVGLAIGDQALLMAYERLGARLPALLTHCGATPCALVLEWCWLGQAPRASVVPLLGLILVGVALAMLPERGEIGGAPQERTREGVLLSLCSAAALAVAAVVARRGFAAGMPVGGAGVLTAATLRGLGGCTGVWLPVAVVRDRTPLPATRTAWWWLVGAALAGPGLGVAFYQAALARLPSAEVQAVVALVPIVVLLLAWWSEGRRPRRLLLLGAALAVAGTAGLAWRH